ncbi:MAG: SDR family oxidoreductase [Chloroflexota bacterium]
MAEKALSTMTVKILVTGAPGNVGTEVVKALRGKAPFRIGAYHLETARQTLGGDQEYVQFDFLDPSTFTPTFSGIEKIFLIRPPALAKVKRDIAPALYAAKQAGVKHIVFLSIQGVDKNRVVPHYKIEQLIIELGFTYIFLRGSFFMQNLSTTHQADIRDKSEIALPVGKARTSFIDVRDIATIAAKMLLQPGDENMIYTLTGSEALDYYQVADQLTASLGRPIHYTHPSILKFVRQQLTEGRKLSMTLVMAALYTITRFGNAQEVTSDVQNILGRSPILFEQFLHDYRSCWLPIKQAKLEI